MLLPLPVMAQSEDEGRLVRFIEDTLSDGAARSVDLQGFRGALSSEAELDRLTVADASGIWLEIEGAVLNWNRAAVLRGEIDIRRLSADRVVLHRLPEAEPSGPTAEAMPFALPDLPVSIDIETAAIDVMEIGAPVLGQPVAATASASLTLSGGQGGVAFGIERIDDQVGEISLDASFDNASTEVTLDLRAREEEGGLAVSLLGIEDAPSVELQVSGAGPLDAFDARFALASEGIDRLSGTANISSSDSGGRRASFAVGGDLRALVSGDLETFLGDDAQLEAIANLPSDGSIELQSLQVQSAALELNGSLLLDPDRAPVRFDLAGDVRPPSGAETLALPGGQAEIAAAEVNVIYDRGESDRVAGLATLIDLQAAGFSAPETVLALDGSLRPDQFDGRIELESTRLDHNDPRISEALGPSFTLSSDLMWETERGLDLSALALETEGSRLDGALSLRPGPSRMDLDAELRLTSADLSPFGLLAGQPLGGAVEAVIDLQLEALSGAFETVFDAQAQDLRVPESLPDALIAGESTLSGHIIRDSTGMVLEELRLSGSSLGLEAQGRLSTLAADLTVAAELADAAVLDDRLAGAVTLNAAVLRESGGDLYELTELEIDSDLISLSGAATASPGDARFPVTADVQADIALAAWSGLAQQNLSGDLALTVTAEGDVLAQSGTAAIAATGLDLGAVGLPRGLFAGETELSAQLGLADNTLSVTLLELAGEALSANLSGRISSDTQEASLAATLRNGQLFSPALPGPVSLEADISQSGTEPYTLDATVQGTAGLQARLSGTATPDPQVDLTIQGALPLSLADPFITPQTLAGRARFDLAMRGAPGLDALSGSVTTSDARFGLPTQNLALESIQSRADIGNGVARLDLTAGLRPAGTLGVSGQVTLSDPRVPADLDIRLDQGRIIDPALYDVAISQLRLALRGALLGSPRLSGQIDLGVVELRVPETGFGSATPIPDIRHVGETQAERRTRLFAGLLDTSGAAGSGMSLLLDLGVAAPGRIFLRGRGLDAELGGTVRLSGTSQNPIASGQFELIRGRLSILGQRLDLTEGSVTLQGGEPFLSLTAATDAGAFRIFISVIGNASAPEVRFRSAPELPEDEVLAQLLFGRSVGSLSAVQALQLVDGVAGLTGGGSGVFTRLRDEFGLDDLDIRTDEAGNAAVTAGRYISENVYTDVTVEDGGTGVSINIDLTPSLTARGGVDSDGSSSVGIFFERDY